MQTRELTIRNRLGLHARAAGLFVRVAGRYRSEIGVEKDGIRVNGKSVMGLLTLAAAKGAQIVIFVEGEDEVEAIEELGELIDGKFNEK